jgi:hypothetical protein
MKNSSIRTKLTLPALAILALAVFGSSTVWGQASGANFTASVDNTVCTINSINGALVTPPFSNAEGGSLTVQIKLPNSSPGLLVEPSLVTGLYTNTTSTQSVPGNQTAAIVVTVTDTVNGVTTDLTPNNTCVVTNTQGTKCGTVYDERFQFLNFTGMQTVQLIQSTMAAHSFNFTRGQVPGGIHTVQLNWWFGCDDGTGTLRTSACKTTFAPNTAAACAGPGTLAVTQVQQFHHSSQIGTTGP